MRMDYKIKKEYPVSNVHEISVDGGGWNYLVIYGKHVNGWFIVVPNWNVCTEASCPEDDSYNTEKIFEKIGSIFKARIIAEAIKEHWEVLNN